MQIMQKHDIRKDFKRKRNRLTAHQVAHFSTQIANNFIANLLPTLPSNSTFSLYLDAYHEVQTNQIAQHFINHNIAFCYPKITQLHTPLTFILHHKGQKFTKSSFFPSIIEPENGQKIDPDILIVPLLAFDSNFFRLGMGGGFFDRTIKKLHHNKKITKIGLAYDFQASKTSLAYEKTDQKLDIIVTQNNLFYANPTVR